MDGVSHGNFVEYLGGLVSGVGVEPQYGGLDVVVGGKEAVLDDEGVDLGAGGEGARRTAGDEDEGEGVVVSGGGGGRGAEEEAEEGEGRGGVGAAGMGADEGVVHEGVGRGGGAVEEEGGVGEGRGAEGAGGENEAAEGEGVAVEAAGDEKGVGGAEVALGGAAPEESHAAVPCARRDGDGDGDGAVRRGLRHHVGSTWVRSIGIDGIGRLM